MLQHAAAGELHQADAIIHCGNDHGAERGIDKTGCNKFTAGRLARGRPEGFHESITEPAVGLVAVIVDRVIDGTAAAYLHESAGQPPAPLPLGKCHAVILHKPPSCFLRG